LGNKGFEVTRRRNPGYGVLEREWAEQREYCYPVKASMVTADQNDPGWHTFVASELLPRLDTVRHPVPPSRARGAAWWRRVPHEPGAENAALDFNCDQLEIAFDPAEGSIIGLTETDTGHRWASAEKRLAQLQYQTFSTADFDYFNRQYNPGCGPPCGAFSKPGMSIGVSATYSPRLVSFHRAADGECSFC